MKEYFLSVICGAVLCGIVTGFLEKKGAAGKVLKLICGAFLTFTVIRPVADVQLDSLSFFMEDILADAAFASEMGENRSREAMASIIKLETQAYILDKATAEEGELSVEAFLDDHFVPCSVIMTGRISNVGRAELERIIADELGIPKEEQFWKVS